MRVAQQAYCRAGFREPKAEECLGQTGQLQVRFPKRLAGVQAKDGGTRETGFPS